MAVGLSQETFCFGNLCKCAYKIEEHHRQQRLHQQLTTIVPFFPITTMMDFLCTSFVALSFLCAQVQAQERQPVSISDEVMANFRQSQGIKPDYQLPIQTIGDENTVTLPDGTVVSLSDMKPRSYFTSSAKCFENDRRTPCPQPTVSVKTDAENGLKVIAANDEHGEILNILVIDEASGIQVSFETIAPGYVTYIPVSDILSLFQRFSQQPKLA